MARSYEDVRLTAAYRGDLHVLVEAPDGTMACSTIMWLDQANRTVEFEPVGTHPDYRRLGLARAMMLHGMQLARAAGANHATVVCLGAPGACLRARAVLRPGVPGALAGRAAGQTTPLSPANDEDLGVDLRRRMERLARHPGTLGHRPPAPPAVAVQYEPSDRRPLEHQVGAHEPRMWSQQLAHDRGGDGERRARHHPERTGRKAQVLGGDLEHADRLAGEAGPQSGSSRRVRFDREHPGTGRDQVTGQCPVPSSDVEH